MTDFDALTSLGNDDLQNPDAIARSKAKLLAAIAAETEPDSVVVPAPQTRRKWGQVSRRTIAVGLLAAASVVLCALLVVFWQPPSGSVHLAPAVTPTASGPTGTSNPSHAEVTWPLRRDQDPLEGVVDGPEGFNVSLADEVTLRNAEVLWRNECLARQGVPVPAEHAALWTKESLALARNYALALRYGPYAPQYPSQVHAAQRAAERLALEINQTAHFAEEWPQKQFYRSYFGLPPGDDPIGKIREPGTAIGGCKKEFLDRFFEPGSTFTKYPFEYHYRGGTPGAQTRTPTVKESFDWPYFVEDWQECATETANIPRTSNLGSAATLGGWWNKTMTPVEAEKMLTKNYTCLRKVSAHERVQKMINEHYALSAEQVRAAQAWQAELAAAVRKAAAYLAQHSGSAGDR